MLYERIYTILLHKANLLSLQTLKFFLFGLSNNILAKLIVDFFKFEVTTIFTSIKQGLFE